jgi:hypothetical protein
VDPQLHAFIAELVSYDPLTLPGAREEILRAAAAAALATGRAADALVALDWLGDAPAESGPSSPDTALKAAADQAVWTGRSF